MPTKAQSIRLQQLLDALELIAAGCHENAIELIEHAAFAVERFGTQADKRRLAKIATIFKSRCVCRKGRDDLAFAEVVKER